MITGFRWHSAAPSSSTAYARTSRPSARRSPTASRCPRSAAGATSCELGSRDRDGDNVFLLSTTHGAETPSLAAAIRTMQVYKEEPVVEHLHRQGERLRTGLEAVARARGLERHFGVVGRACNLLYSTLDAEGARPRRSALCSCRRRSGEA